MRRIVILMALALLSAGASSAQITARVSERMTLDVGGVERVYSLYVPDNLDAPAPLVIALHGRFSSGKALEATSKIDRRADENGWIVAYPQAYEYSWEDGGRELGLPRVGENPQDDVAFIDQLIETLSAEHDISGVTGVGFDTGGSMIERYLCEGATKLTGAMLVGTVGWSYFDAQCGAKIITTDILLVYGVYDQVYTPIGEDLIDYPQPDGSLIHRMGFYETVQYWAARANCIDLPEQVGQTSVFTDCAQGTTVAAMLLTETSHDWPRSGAYQATPNTDPINDGGALVAALIGKTLPVDAVPAPDLPPIPRTYIAYVPTTYTGEEPMPLIVALHGRPDTGAGFATITDLTVVAEREGFIVVFPDGLRNEWNYLQNLLAGDEFEFPDDVTFLSTLPDDLALDLNIDLSRMYMTGFSNGGFMTYRMACNPNPNRYAAYSVAGALMYPEMELLCLGAETRPLIVEHGTEDISISWDGITHMPTPGHLAVTRNVLQSVSFWAAHNGCVSNGAVRTNLPPSDDKTNVLQFDFAECTSGDPVRLYAIEGGGHAWPGVDHLRHEIAGEVNMDINYSVEIWEFFKDKSLDDSVPDVGGTPETSETPELSETPESSGTVEPTAIPDTRDVTEVTPTNTQ